jgi:hypothetical protein
MRRLRPGSEDGIALIMAVLILAVLTVTTVTMISYTSSSSRDASLKKSGQTAYAHAEAGLNNALSQLASHYSPPGSTVLYDNSWVGGSTTYADGSADWSGVFTDPNGSGSSGYWTLTANGSASNPTGPGAAAVKRTITGRIYVGWTPHTDGTPSVWNYVFSGGTGCTTISNSVEVTAPLYVPGNLCLGNTAKLLGANTISVGGNLVMTQSANTVGTQSSPIPEVHISGSCTYRSWTYSPCQANQVPPTSGTDKGKTSNVWASTFDNTLPTTLTAPVVDWNDAYKNASPGPYAQCVESASGMPTDGSGRIVLFDKYAAAAPSGVPDGMNDNATQSSNPFNLTPTGSDYTCKGAGGGELSWNHATHELTANGTIFIDGSVWVDTSNTVKAYYTGSASIYVRGSVVIKNNSTLCAGKELIDASDPSGCHMSTDTSDPDRWQPCSGASGFNNMITFFANGNGEGQANPGDSVEVNGSSFQGGLYGTNNIEINNSAWVQGPLITPSLVNPDNSGAVDFPGPVCMQDGTGGDTFSPLYQLGALKNVSY